LIDHPTGTLRVIDRQAVIEHYGRAGLGAGLGDLLLAALKVTGKDIDHV
jgi:hypothetical protein